MAKHKEKKPASKMPASKMPKKVDVAVGIFSEASKSCDKSSSKKKSKKK